MSQMLQNHSERSNC